MSRLAALVLLAALAGCKGNLNNNEITLAITSRVSLDSGGHQATGFSDSPSISAAGRYVAFRSAANNLVPSDPGGWNDIFLRDNQAGITLKMTAINDFTAIDEDTGIVGGIGVASAPVPPPTDADNHSFDPFLSADGRTVAFATFATNLTSPADEAAYSDVYTIDVAGRFFKRISKPYNVSTVNGHSSKPSLSQDGRFVAFQSDANNLVAGDGGFTDVFFVSSGVTTLLSRGGTPSDGNSTNALISGNGAYIVFQSTATNLTGIADGNAATDIFRVDTATAAIDLVSADVTGLNPGNGASVDPVVSSDGRFVVFTSSASNLVASGIDNNAAPDIYIRDMVLGVTARVSTSIAGSDPDGACLKPTMSADAQFVAFESPATNLIGLDTNNAADVFIRNLVTGEMQRASVKTFGGEAAGTSFSPRISGDGKFVALGSAANNLVEKDTNALNDVFLRGPLK